MGASQSRSETNEKVFHSETPISFSPDVVNQLSNRLESPGTSPERQTILDAHIRARIQDELEHLRREEEQVQKIERALEKENLDKERAMTGDASEGDGSGTGDVKSSTALQGDLGEIREKINKYQTRKELTEYPEVKTYGDAVVECYSKNPTRTLDCWKEVDRFKTSVAKLEQEYFKTLQ
ncbi:hypothetical protein AN958_08201 [Leucoagaricus sp. SymC.cos]|nr:hypothetical protein AN958_08201 [Leucoagaricus sp. SymC.cos]